MTFRKTITQLKSHLEFNFYFLVKYIILQSIKLNSLLIVARLKVLYARQKTNGCKIKIRNFYSR